MLIIVAGMMWLVCRVLEIVTDVPNAAATKRGLGVHRIWVDHAEQYMWVYRPRDCIVQLNLATGNVEISLPAWGDEIAHVAHCNDGPTALVCGHDGTVTLHRDGEEQKVAKASSNAGLPLAPLLSEDGSVALFVTALGHVRGWSRNGTDVREFNYATDSPSKALHAGLNSTGRRLFIARDDGVVSFYASETGVQDQTDLHVGVGCCACAWSEDEQLFVAVRRDGFFQVHLTETGRVHWEGHIGSRCDFCARNRLKVSPDGRLIAVSTNLNTVAVWDLMAGKTVGQLCGHNGLVCTMQFSRDSRRLFTGSYDNTIREWSLESYAQMRIIN